MAASYSRPRRRRRAGRQFAATRVTGATGTIYAIRPIPTTAAFRTITAARALSTFGAVRTARPALARALGEFLRKRLCVAAVAREILPQALDVLLERRKLLGARGNRRLDLPHGALVERGARRGERSIGRRGV